MVFLDRMTEGLERNDDLVHVLPTSSLEVHHDLDVAHGQVPICV